MICHCSRREFRLFRIAEMYLHFFVSFFPIFVFEMKTKAAEIYDYTNYAKNAF